MLFVSHTIGAFRSFYRIQTQAALATLRIGTVTLKTTVGEQRTDVAIEPNVLGRIGAAERRNQHQHAQEQEHAPAAAECESRKTLFHREACQPPELHESPKGL